jgi:transcriptional regulator with XRE-family HTH domain
MSIRYKRNMAGAYFEPLGYPGLEIPHKLSPKGVGVHVSSGMSKATANCLEEPTYNCGYEMSKEIIPTGLNIFSRESLAQKIQDLRKSRGMKQAELAKICGISQVSVSKWERGEKAATPSAKNLLILSDLAPEADRQWWRDQAAEQAGFDLDDRSLTAFTRKQRSVPLLKEGSNLDLLGKLSPEDVERELDFPDEWFSEGGIIRALHVRGEGIAKMIALVDISRRDPEPLAGSLVAVRASTGIEVRWLSRDDGVDMLWPFHRNQLLKTLKKSGDYSLVGLVCCTVGDSAEEPMPDDQTQ